MPDQPTRLQLTAAFAALLQALSVVVLAGAKPRFDPAGRGVYQQNRWAALRHGPRAELVHPFRDRLVPVPELAAELVDLVGPVAADLGTRELLEPLLRGGCEGDETARDRSCTRPGGSLRRTRSADYDHLVAELTDTLQVTGIRCERCVNRLALVLRDHEGLLAANANLMGRVVLTWDDEVTDRGALLEALERGGFREAEPAE